MFSRLDEDFNEYYMDSKSEQNKPADVNLSAHIREDYVGGAAAHPAPDRSKNKGDSLDKNYQLLRKKYEGAKNSNDIEELKKVIKSCDKILKKNPYFYQAACLRARAKSITENSEKAVSELMLYVKINQFPQGHNGMCYAVLATLYDKSNNFERSLEYAKKGVKGSYADHIKKLLTARIKKRKSKDAQYLSQAYEIIKEIDRYSNEDDTGNNLEHQQQNSSGLAAFAAAEMPRDEKINQLKATAAIQDDEQKGLFVENGAALELAKPLIASLGNSIGLRQAPAVSPCHSVETIMNTFKERVRKVGENVLKVIHEDDLQQHFAHVAAP